MLECLFLFFYLNLNDDISYKIPQSVQYIKSTLSISPSERQPIRITFNFSSNDSQTCTSIGQSITWGGGTYVCESMDILNSSQINAITGTLDSLKLFLEGALKVTPLKVPLNLKSLSNYFTIDPFSVNNTDLYIFVLSRPFNDSSYIAQSASYITEFGEKRPIQGFILLNPKYIPNEPENESYHPNNYFDTLFHETCHVLGISGSSYKNWINRTTSQPYSPFPNTTLTFGTKKFNILHTPQCHKYATKRFGTETFTLSGQSCPSGVELEDGGGYGTEGVHPEARVYMNEIMVGVLHKNCVISDLVLSMLYDTGWYEVNYLVAKGLVWGNGLSINDQPINNFALGPPQTTFPSHYLCKSNQENNEICSFDFSSVVICYSNLSNCSNPINSEEIFYCNNLNFFNPKNELNRGNNSIHDFMLFGDSYSSKFCHNPLSNRFIDEESFGPDSKCFISGSKAFCLNTRCEGYRLFVSYNNSEIECLYLNQTFILGSKTFLCHNPELVCRSKIVEKKFNQDPFNEILNNNNNNYFLEILAISCATLAAGSISSYIYLNKKKNNSSNSSSSSNSKDKI